MRAEWQLLSPQPSFLAFGADAPPAFVLVADLAAEEAARRFGGAQIGVGLVRHALITIDTPALELHFQRAAGRVVAHAAEAARLDRFALHRFPPLIDTFFTNWYD